MSSEIRFYLAMFWRRLPLFFLVFLLIGGSGVLVAISLPAVYQSQARMILESPQIPDELAASTVRMPAQEQLQLFETRLLTRENLLDIANRLQVFPQQNEMNPDEIVRAMRSNTTVFSSASRNSAKMMTVTFTSTSPSTAASVVGEYLTFVLAEDVENRSTRAGQTEEFFQQEVDRLGSELSNQRSRILSFKNENADALPDGLGYRRDLQLNLQDRVTQINREVTSLREQKDRLQQVYEITGRTGQGQGNTSLSPEQQRLASLRAQLSELEGVYAEDSPRVVSLRNRVETLENSLARKAAAEAEDAAAEEAAQPRQVDPSQLMFDLQIDEIDSQIAQLVEQRAQIETQLETLSDSIARTPANAIALEALERDYENIQKQYNSAVARLSTASTGERIETLSRGQRVTVVEQPAVPSSPFKPNRRLIAAAGLGMGFIAGLGLIVLLELLSSTAKRSTDIENGLGITPLATIPYLRTRGQAMRRRLVQIAATVLVVILIPIGLWVVHTQYMPFDEIVQKIAARAGFQF